MILFSKSPKNRKNRIFVWKTEKNRISPRWPKKQKKQTTGQPVEFDTLNLLIKFVCILSNENMPKNAFKNRRLLLNLLLTSDLRSKVNYEKQTV